MIRKVFVVSQILICTAVFAGSDQVESVRQFVAAYNSEDLEEMLSLVADDLRWMSVDDDTVSIETHGKAALSSALQQAFASDSFGYSTLVSISSAGTFVTALEQAHWQSNGDDKSLCSIAIYQFEDSLIVNVWYFAAFKCDS